MTSGLAPRWASAPGATIRSIMDERDLGIEDLAAALGSPVAEAKALLAGQAPISADRADRLSRTFGASARFWLTREAEYVEDRFRVMAADWSTSLPLSDMRDFGWIRTTRDWHDQIDQCLTFFGVDDFEEWLDRYPRQARVARYRTSVTFENDENATLVWFRAGDLEARQAQRHFDADGLRASLPALRRLTRIANPERFVPELERIAAGSGVTVRIVPAPDGCRASGATRWIQGAPVIQLSARHLSDDHFWFTFFHEVGHILCHNKKHETFIDLDMDAAGDDDLEDEADRFAESVILGEATNVAELSRGTYRDLIHVAARLGISPGLLVGQLQHWGYVGRDQFNRLKRRYRWEGTTLVAK